MQTSKNHPIKFSILFFLLTSTAFATEVEKTYQFQTSPACFLQKRVNMDWVKANPSEVASIEPFSLHETFNHPELSTFYANHGVYSAPSACFVPVTENETKPETKKELAEEKREEKKEEEIEEETESEFLHQTRYRILEITPSIGYLSSTVNFKNVSSDSDKTTGLVTGAILEYGLSDHISIGANLAYDRLSDTLSGESSTSLTGLEDPKFFLNGKTDFGNSELRLNLLFNTPVSHPKIEANGDSNVATGSFTFTPALGYEYHLPYLIFGAQIAYDLVKSDAKEDTIDQTGAVATDTEQGGKALIASVFFEHRFHKGEIGLSVQYEKVAHTNDDGFDVNDGGSIWVATLYGEIEFNEKISLLPAVVFSHSNFSDGVDSENLDNVKNISGTIAARFKF